MGSNPGHARGDGRVSGVQCISALLNAFNNALRDNVQIINMSMTWRQENMKAQEFNSAGNSPINLDRLVAATSTARDKDIVTSDIFITLATQPSLRDTIIVVASSDMLGQLSAYSAFGKEVVSLAAPGDHILVFNTEGEDQYYYEYGTSFAAPHVTGALVLLLSAFPHCKLPQLVHRLLHTVDQSLSLRGKCRSGGRLNIGNALKQDLQHIIAETKYRIDVSLAIEKALLGPSGYPAIFSIEGSMEVILRYYDEHHVEFLNAARLCWHRAAGILEQVVEANDHVINALLVDDDGSDGQHSCIGEWCKQLQSTQSFRKSKLNQFTSQSDSEVFDKKKVFLRDWGFHFASQWFPLIYKVLVDVKRLLQKGSNTTNTTTIINITNVVDSKRLVTLKTDIETWLSRIESLLAIYSEIGGSVGDINQVNWLSTIRLTEVKWLGFKVNIADWKDYYIALSSALESLA
eukprot:gene29614-38736_t